MYHSLELQLCLDMGQHLGGMGREDVAALFSNIKLGLDLMLRRV